MNREQQFDSLLRSLSQTHAVAPVHDPCPAPEAFWDAISGALAPEEVLSLSEHATRCPFCREAWELTRDMYRESHAVSSAHAGEEFDSWGVGSSVTFPDAATGFPSYALAESEPESEIHQMGTPSAGPEQRSHQATLRAFSKSTLQHSPKWMAVAAAFAVIAGLRLDGTFSPSSVEPVSKPESPVWRSIDYGKRWEKVSQQRSRLCWEPLGPEFHYYVLLLDSDLGIISERFVNRDTCLDLASDPIEEQKARRVRYWRIKALAETGLEVYSPSTQLRDDWLGAQVSRNAKPEQGAPSIPR